MINIARRKKMVSRTKVILATTGILALVIAYFVWTQPLETIRILVALNFLIIGISQLSRAFWLD